MNPTYLRKRGTNEIFIYTDFLMSRSENDMIPYDGIVPMPKENIPVAETIEYGNPIKQPQSVQNEPIIPVEEKQGDDSVNRIALIVEAIRTLIPEEYTQLGLPKVEILSKYTGLEVNSKERDEAWSIFQKEK